MAYGLKASSCDPLSNILESVLLKLQGTKPRQIDSFAPSVSDFKVAHFFQVIICPISQIWVLFSCKIIKFTQLGGKTIRLLTSV